MTESLNQIIEECEGRLITVMKAFQMKIFLIKFFLIVQSITVPYFIVIFKRLTLWIVNFMILNLRIVNLTIWYFVNVSFGIVLFKTVNLLNLT